VRAGGREGGAYQRNNNVFIGGVSLTQRLPLLVEAMQSFHKLHDVTNYEHCSIFKHITLVNVEYKTLPAYE